MKNFLEKLFMLLTLFGMVCLGSCSDDDDDNGGPTDRQITFDGQTYTLKEGYVIDYGNFYAGYTNYDFVLTDGQFSQSRGRAENAGLVIFAELISPDENAFQTGTYTYNDSADPGQVRYFYDAGIFIDSDNDDQITALDDYIEAEGGSIEVSGSPFDYTVTFNLTLEGGRTLSGSFSGTFTYYDESDERRFPDNSQLKINTLHGLKK